MAIVKGECLEADEADDVSMANPLPDDAASVEQLGLDLDVGVQIAGDGDMGDVQGGHSALVGQRSRPPHNATWVVAEELDDHEGLRVGAPFPPPGRSATVFVRRASQVQVTEVPFEGSVRLDFNEEWKVDHQINVTRACVRPDAGRRVRDKVARREATDEVNAAFPRTEPAKQSNEDALASLRCLIVVVAVVRGHGSQ